MLLSARVSFISRAAGGWWWAGLSLGAWSLALCSNCSFSLARGDRAGSNVKGGWVRHVLFLSTTLIGAKHSGRSLRVSVLLHSKHCNSLHLLWSKTQSPNLKGPPRPHLLLSLWPHPVFFPLILSSSHPSLFAPVVVCQMLSCLGAFAGAASLRFIPKCQHLRDAGHHPIPISLPCFISP